MEINGKQISDRVIHTYLKMLGPKIWGLTFDKGYKRPQVIEHNGEWYIMVIEDKEFFDHQYFDYTKDIECGIYVPTGIKVGEE